MELLCHPFSAYQFQLLDNGNYLPIKSSGINSLPHLHVLGIA